MEAFQTFQDHEKRIRALERRLAPIAVQAQQPVFTGSTGDLLGQITTEQIEDDAVTAEKIEGPLPLLTADPSSPVDDTWWAVREGTSPTEVSIKVRISGATYPVAQLTLP